MQKTAVMLVLASVTLAGCAQQQHRVSDSPTLGEQVATDLLGVAMSFALDDEVSHQGEIISVNPECAPTANCRGEREARRGEIRRVADPYDQLQSQRERQAAMTLRNDFSQWFAADDAPTATVFTASDDSNQALAQQPTRVPSIVLRDPDEIY
ncbi:MAG: hypothetical protein AAGJ86_00735 [Pseudomonadota bacterium]